MGTTPVVSASLTNSSNAFTGTMRLATSEDEDDEPPGCPRHSPIPRLPQVTTHIPAIPLRTDSWTQTNDIELVPRDGPAHTLANAAPRAGKLHHPASRTVPQDGPSAAPDRTRMAGLRSLFEPSHPLGPSPGYLPSIKSAITYTPLNVCLAFIPVSWALHYSHQSDTLTFICSALAIIPLAAQLTLATEQIALRTSQSVGGLVNATFGNIVELIIGGIALARCDLALVQSSLLGGLISNLLLVLGTAFIVGGYRFHQQEFQPMAAQLNTSLMTVAVISLLVPAAFHEFLGDRLENNEGPLLLKLSRGSSIVLILIYFAYLAFQFYSHNDMFMDSFELKSFPGSSRSSMDCSDRTAILPQVDPTIMPLLDYEKPKINGGTSIALLVCATMFTYLTADNLVSSLNGMVEHSNISKEWVTLIIIPIISNAAEHTTAAIVASKGKFDLVMSVAVGSCIQIALFVIPVLILIAWGLGKPLTLLFDPIETMCLFLSVLLVKFSVGDGKAHWMSGVALIGVYVLIAISFWDYPIVEASPLSCT